jgi:phenylalanyl-tRNA synthetase beta chain
MSQWVDTAGVDPLAFADRFTCTVAEIDHVVQVGRGLEQVVVADVVAVQPHPNADKLRLATVELGGRQETIVCGAPDLAVGQRVPFVPPGVTLPSGIEVKRGEIRGVPSHGMLASEADLGLSDDHGGLLQLTGCTAPAGTPLPEAVALTDVLYDVDNKAITHRPDLWGQYGMARELAAMLGKPLAPLDEQVTLGQGAPLPVLVDDDAPCQRYVCARVAGVAVAPSPVEVRLQLRRCGVRPISNVVDATNLVMLETGNPLHAFDARHLRGDRIQVRRARPGEVLQTLDGQDRVLTGTDCVIADGEGPVALAGVMGGAHSEIRPDTAEVVLEAAAFDAPAIRKTAMRFGMRTESSARFEKALDPALPPVVARRFLRLVLRWSPGARVVSGLLDVGPAAVAPPAPVAIHTTASYLRQRLGVDATELTDAWLDGCLAALAFVVQRHGDALTVQVPSFRATKDVRIAEDLVEELGRHYGYQRIRSEAPLVAARPPHTPPARLLERALRSALVQGAGLTEVLLYGFDDEAARGRLGLEDGPRVGVRNPISHDLRSLRRSMGPNLIAAIERALGHGDGRQEVEKGLQVGLFELGRVFLPVPPGERAGVDLGVPAVLGSIEREAYLGRMDGELRAGTLSAEVHATPLPDQPACLGIALGERLGGGSEGAKVTTAPRATSQRLMGELLSALQVAGIAAGRGEWGLRWLPEAELRGQLPSQPSWLHPARSALVTCGGVAVGWVTALHPHVRAKLTVAAEVVLAEVWLPAVLDLPELRRTGHAPAALPSSSLDLTVDVAPEVKAATVLEQLRQRWTAKEWVERVEHVASYEAPTTDDRPQRRALTFRLRCRHPERTLTRDDLAALAEQARTVLVRFGQVAAGATA